MKSIIINFFQIVRKERTTLFRQILQKIDTYQLNSYYTGVRIVHVAGSYFFVVSGT